MAHAHGYAHQWETLGMIMTCRKTQNANCAGGGNEEEKSAGGGERGTSGSDGKMFVEKGACEEDKKISCDSVPSSHS